MNTQRPQFDSHRFVKRLTMAGLSEEVAEILADEHTKLIVPGDVATRADLEALGARLDSVSAQLATKANADALDSIAAQLATKANSDALDSIAAQLATKANSDALDSVRAEMATKADVEALGARLDSVSAQLATKADADALDSIRAEMATKEDLRREIAACEARMEQRLQNAILEAKVSLIKWMIATMAVFSGVVIGAIAALQ